MKRKSEDFRADDAVKRYKTDSSKKQVATVKPEISQLFSSFKDSADKSTPSGNKSGENSSSLPPKADLVVVKEDVPSVGDVDVDFQFNAFDEDDLDWEEKEEERTVESPLLPVPTAFRYLVEFPDWCARKEKTE